MFYYDNDNYNINNLNIYFNLINNYYTFYTEK